MADDFATDPRRGCADVDTEVFFADRGGQLDQARAVCLKRCPFTEECFQRAVQQQERFGLWGGVLMSSGAERRKAIARRQEFQIIKGWQKGLSDGDIALRVDLHPGTVQKIRTELGLPSLYGPGGRRRVDFEVAA